MNLASSTKHVLLALSIGVISAACGGDDTTTTPDAGTTTYTWTKVSSDMKTSCAIATSCHQATTAQTFSYDKTLTPGSDMANYASLMAAGLIDKTNPANSAIIVSGKGGAYMGKTHSGGATLSATQAANWAAWIAAGATFQ